MVSEKRPVAPSEPNTSSVEMWWRRKPAAGLAGTSGAEIPGPLRLDSLFRRAALPAQGAALPRRDWRLHHPQ